MRVQEILSNSANYLDQTVEIEGILKILSSKSNQIICIRDFNHNEKESQIELNQSINVLDGILFPLQLYSLLRHSPEYEIPITVVGSLVKSASDEFPLALDRITEVSLNIEYDELCKILTGTQTYNFTVKIDYGEFARDYGVAKSRLQYTYRLDIGTEISPESSSQVSVREALESIQTNSGKQVILTGFPSIYAPQIPLPEDWETNQEARTAYKRKRNEGVGFYLHHEKYDPDRLTGDNLSECVVVDWFAFYYLIRSVVPSRVPIPYTGAFEITGKLGYSKIEPFLVAITDLRTIIARDATYSY